MKVQAGLAFSSSKLYFTEWEFGGDGSKFARTFKALSKMDNQLLVYIDKVMFKERSELRLNKRDIEHYILKELGEACTSRVVNDIFKIIDQSNVRIVLHYRQW